MPPSLTVSPDTQTILIGDERQLLATYSDPWGPGEVPPIVWTSLDSDIATVSSSGLVTGVKRGVTSIVVAAAGLADTSRVTVARTPAEVTIEPIIPVAPGDQVQLVATVRDTEGQLFATPTILWGVSDAAVAQVSMRGLLTALREGTVTVTAAARPVSTNTTIEIRIPPPPPDCEGQGMTLMVGETREYDGGAPLSICLAGTAEYLLVAANPDATGAAVQWVGEGLSPASSPPDPDLIPSGRRELSAAPEPLDIAFERDLRQRERDQLSPVRSRGPAALRALTAGPPVAVGDLLPLSTSADCRVRDERVGRVEFIGQHAIVVADTANPANGFTRSDYTRIGITYDTLLYSVVTGSFGEPAGLNGESRAVIFYTRAVNELTPRDADGVVAGFFWAGDLFPVAGPESCAGSNEREMFYMLAADPEGEINGNERALAFVERVTEATVAHELQHLVNASRRRFVNDADDWETPWLNEGLSHLAEELVYYRASGYAPRRNLGPQDMAGTQAQVDVANKYAAGNLLRLDRYLSAVSTRGPFQIDVDLATRGAIWQYLRYLLDRDGRDQRQLLAALVNTTTSGFANLEAVFGVDPREAFVDNVVSLYVDDVVTTIGPDYRQPSWQFRPILEWITDGYALAMRSIGVSPATVRLEGSGAAFARTAVHAGRIGQIRIGTEETPPPAQLRFVLMRIR